MKLPMPTFNEIHNLAVRAEEAIYVSGARKADIQIIENAIRNALAIVVDRLNVEIPQPIGLDLSKT